MIRIADRKRAGVVALLAVLTGAASLMFGAGQASANASYCRTDGTAGDATIHLPGVAFVQVDQHDIGSPTSEGIWVCVVPPDQGAGVGMRDPGGAPGFVFGTETCGTLTTTYPDRCVGLRNATGVEVGTPTTSLDAPFTGASGSSGAVGTGSGTCVYIDSYTGSCPLGGVSLAGVTVAEGDLMPSVTPTSTTPPPACTGINNTCPGATVRTGSDPATPTVQADVLGTTLVRQDVGGQCVQVNSVC